MTGMGPIQILRLAGLPMIGPDSDLCAEIAGAMERSAIALQDGDIVVVAQKVVSKAEGRKRALSDYVPSPAARDLASTVNKDARLVEAVLSESRAVIRAVPNVLIVEHRLGHIMANAGIDQSNVETDGADGETILLLPEDPDASAGVLRDRLRPHGVAHIGVIVSDSFGRPWRIGTTGVAIGIAGVPAVIDRRGEKDIFGRVMQVTEVGFADAVASAACLAMGEGAEAIPAAIVRGLDWHAGTCNASDGLRDPERDLFR